MRQYIRRNQPTITTALLALTIITLLSGCIGIGTPGGGTYELTGSSRHVVYDISSDQNGDEVYIDGRLVGVTPVRTTVQWNFPLIGDNAINHPQVIVKRGSKIASQDLRLTPIWDSSVVSVYLVPQ